MYKSLTKLLRILCGFSDLITTMDKGFGKIETDNQLIGDFKSMSYTWLNQLDSQMNTLNHSLKTDGIGNETDPIKNLNNIRAQAKTILYELECFTADYKNRWRKTTSLNVLEKFYQMLLKEMWILEEEMDRIIMHLTIHSRQKMINQQNKAHNSDVLQGK